MPKPEKILLQEKAWRKHATLANGVKCGEEAAFPAGLASAGSRGSITGWREHISLTGQLMSGLMAYGHPDGDTDSMFRVRDRSRGWETRDVSDQFSNRRILGIMTNSVMPDLVRVVIDAGEDTEQPGQRECDTALLGTDDLDERLVDLLKFWRMLPEDYQQPQGPSP